MNYPVPAGIKLEKGAKYISVPGYNHALTVDDSERDQRTIIFHSIGSQQTSRTWRNNEIVRMHHSIGDHIHIDQSAHVFKMFHEKSFFAPNDLQADINAVKFALDKGVIKSLTWFNFNNQFKDDLPLDHLNKVKEFIQQYDPEKFIPYQPERGFPHLHFKIPEPRKVTFTFFCKPVTWYDKLKAVFKRKK